VTSQLNSSPYSLLNLLKPLRLAGVFYFLFLIILSSCSSFIIPLKTSKSSNLTGNYKEMSGQDYEDHLASLKSPFLNSPDTKVFRLDEQTRKYIENLLSDIIANNEIFFKKLKRGTINVLDTESPLHFSLPKGEIFVSRGLITKYIKNESMLVCVLSYELVRSERLLYPKQTIIPIGYIPLEKMLNLNRLTLDEKMEVHKWAHHLTIRSGFDGEYYLSWLQAQNRNTADFILQVGDANQITREESLFKAFLIKSTNDDQVIPRKDSSKSFYTFINRIRDVI
jgi:hypothetical protein